MSNVIGRNGFTKNVLLVLVAVIAALLGVYSVFGGPTVQSPLKLNPLRLNIESAGGFVEDPASWALFDLDTDTTYAPSLSRVAVTLPAATDITSIKVYGNASYSLSVFEDSSGAWVKIPGLEDVQLRTQSAAWNAFKPSVTVRAARLLMEITPTGGNAGGIREIEIWGADPRDPALSLERLGSTVDAEHILAATPRPSHIVETIAAPQTIDVPADANPRAVTFNLSVDPRLIKRAYLLYDAFNADYPVTAEKRINGLSWTGGFAPVASDIPKWTSHLEEIAPSWLATGENKIEFRNQLASRDPSSYFIRNVKVIAELENGWNCLSNVTGTVMNAGHPAEAAFDRDLTTYVSLKSAHTLDLKTDRMVQPASVRLNLWFASGTPAGTVTLQYRQGSQWKTFASGGTIDLATLKSGWNEVLIPAAVATDTIRLAFLVAPDRKRPDATVGGINEISLIASPIGSRTRRGLVVNNPLRGEYFGRTAYLRGFIDPAANPSGAVQVSVEGKTLSNPDGSFSLALTKDETRYANQNDNDAWEAVVTATYPDGSSLTQTVPFTKNLLNNSPSSTGDSNQASASQREKFSDKVVPGQAKKIQYKGVTIEIPADAVDRETEITIIPLTELDLSRLNPGMINVTYPDAGYRFLPHGMKFKKPVKISFGYSKTLFAAGQVDDEVNMYFYDEMLLRWQKLSRVKIDAAVSQVTSESDHFTDIVNSTLVVPEHPQALTFNPNSIKDIKAADPAANVTLIEPPKPDNKGAANLSYPIEIPKGRGAYTPDLRIAYSSGNANGWMGLGWDIFLPSIQVDTRWGTPLYDPDSETESYLLAGQALAPVFKQFDNPRIPRMSDRQFSKRVEGDFLKIIRVGDKPLNYRWVITDKSGIRYYYGTTEGSRLADYASGSIYQWFLDKVIDTNGNVTEYTYFTDTQERYFADGTENLPKNALQGEPWVFVYPATIAYTANEKTQAATQYSIEFVRDAGSRKDLIVGGKSGFKTAQRFRLDHVAVKFRNEIVRSYHMTYTYGEFDKSLLERITVRGAANPATRGFGDVFYSHSFDYNRITRDTNGVLNAFSGTDIWSTPSSDVLSRNEETSKSRNRYRGRGYGAHRSVSYGKIYGYVNATSETKSKFQDLNGDGLPDLVFAGAVNYNMGGPEGQRKFNDVVPVAGLGALELEQRRTDHSGRAYYIPVGSYSQDAASTVSKSMATLGDMNGDGFTDYVSGNSVLFNHVAVNGKFEPGSWSYSTSADLSGMENTMKQHLHLADPVRKWVAPFNGDIVVSGTIQRVKREDAEHAPSKEGDGITLFLYREGSEIGRISIPGDDYTVHLLGEMTGDPGTDSMVMAGIRERDRIYFRLNSVDNGENDEIVFDPQIAYSASGGRTPGELQTLKDVTGRPLYIFRASSDFALSDSQDIVWMSPYQGTVTLSGQFRKLGTPGEVRARILRSTNPDGITWDATVREYVFPANAVETVDINESLVAAEGERFRFDVTSDIIFDPSRAQMTVEAAFSSVRSCRPSEDYSRIVCVDVPVNPTEVDDEGNRRYAFRPAINYPYNPTVPRANIRTWVAPYDGTVKIAGEVSRIGTTQAFTAHILGINKSYWSGRIDAGTSQNALMSTPTPTNSIGHDLTVGITQGDQLFFEVRSEDPFDQNGSASWSPVIAYTEHCQIDAATQQRVCRPVLCSRDADGIISCTPGGGAYYHTPDVASLYFDSNQQDDPFGGGFRQWYYGQWNGNVPWDQSLMVVRTPRDEQDDVFADFVRMCPSQGGTASSAGRPAWTAYEDRAFIVSDSMSSARVAGEVSYSFTAGGVVRQSTGSNTSEGMSLLIGGLQKSHGLTDTQIELLDMNGDRMSDLVTPGGIYLNNGITGFQQQSSAAPGSFRRNYNSNAGANIGIGSIVNAITSGGESQLLIPPTGYTPSVTDFLVVSFSGGYMKGTSTTKSDLVDINGDGLPDLVYQGSSATTGLENVVTVKVRLNLGNRFGQEEEWRLAGWAAVEPDDTEQAFQNKGVSPIFLAPNYIRNNENRSVSVSAGVDYLGYAGASATLGMGVARSEIDLVDVNGDGLPDQVMKLSDENRLRVKINQGGSFGDEQAWAMPGWNVADPIDDLWTTLNPLAAGINKFLKGNDTLTSTTSESIGTGYFVNIPVPVFTINRRRPWQIAFWMIYGRENSSGETTTKSQVTFADIDGDGLPDHVYKNAKSHSIAVRRNEAGMANLLTTVKRPLGGRFTLSYARKGNKVDYSDPNNLTDMPHSQWVLSAVSLSDGMNNTYETSYAYNSGYYSRAEREFYGFRTMTESRGTGGDRVTVVSTFDNQDYYRKGLLLAAETRAGSAAGPVYVAAINDYGVRPEAVIGSHFPYLKSTLTSFYDVLNNTIAKTTMQEYLVYDKYGNILEFVDHADGAGSDIHASIRYDQSNNAEYIVNKPVSIDVKDAGGRLFRSRSASYEKGTGNLKTLSQLVQNGKSAQWTFDYDPVNLNGNLVKITYPAGDPSYNSKAAGYAINYTYDDQVQTYVVAISDSFGYSSSAGYNFSFGLPDWTKDINGNYQVNRYDDFGRASKIYGPYAVNTTGSPVCPPTLSFDYHAPVLDTSEASGMNNAIQTKAYAVTTNRADSSNGCTSATIGTATFADGMKRIIQTRKDATINGANGIVVSGAVEFDKLGRVIKQGQPVPGHAGLETYEETGLVNATVFTFDTLDRTTSITTPEGAITTMVYGFGVPPQGGVNMFKTAVYDPNNNINEPRSGKGVKISYKDAHDRILAVLEHQKGDFITTKYFYDILGQITTVADAKNNTTSISYDLLGRREAIDNPDTGLTKYTYDANGNITTKETAELSKGAKLIKYQYAYNRLARIDYPTSVDVVYEYGSPTEGGDQNGNLAGRIKQVTDESGTEQRWYGRLGETVKELKQINASNNPVARGRYETNYVFDSFGRMTEMTYPDGEVLSYTYDKGGLLMKAVGSKRQNSYKYINAITYDEFGQRKYIEYGNRVKTTYTYNSLTRRLTDLVTTEPTKGRVIQDIDYTYDLVGNILDIVNKAPVPRGGEIGGTTEHHYTYDDLYQLRTANGYHLPAPGKRTTYTNTFDYDIIGNITSKLQTHLIVGATNSQEPRETNYSLTYVYDPVSRPHAVLDAGDKKYAYDKNGNMTGWTSKTTNASRLITWNEENRVKNIADSGNGTSFLYDDQGERVVKGGGGNETVYLNRFYSLKNGGLGSKHIFAGETRVCTKIEKDGGSIQSGVPGANALLVSQGLQHALQQGNGQKRGINRRLVSSGTGTTTTTNPPIEKFEFFYHGDHLGSSSFITDDAGAVYQHLEYFPYGETWVEEGGSGQMPYYRFTGKELDPETGLYYYGARYYDPVLSRWISADPGFEKFLPHARIASGILNEAVEKTDAESADTPKYESALWILRNYSWLENANDDEEKGKNQYQPSGNKLSSPHSKIYEPLIIDLYSYVENAPVNFADPDGKQRKGPGSAFDVGGGGGGGGSGRVGAPRGSITFSGGLSSNRFEVSGVNIRAGNQTIRSVDLGPTLQRIRTGGSYPHRNDGSVFMNKEGLLPQAPKGYYREYVHPTPGVRGPGPQRIIQGRGGETFYTPDHYKTFHRLE